MKCEICDKEIANVQICNNCTQKITNGSKPVDKDWLFNELEYLMNECVVLGGLNGIDLIEHEKEQTVRVDKIKGNILNRLA